MGPRLKTGRAKSDKVPTRPGTKRARTKKPRGNTEAPALTAPAASAVDAQEDARFAELQSALRERWQTVHDWGSGPRDIVVVPSLSLDGFHLDAVKGVVHYEERMLFTLGLLRHPEAHMVFVSSMPIHPAVIDYHMALVGGVPSAHARARLTLLSTYDSTPGPLTQKILDRPRMMERIRQVIHPDRAHLTAFAISNAERALAVKLGIPLYGVDPKLLWLGTKSGSRTLFREAGISFAAGRENLHSQREVAEAVASVWEQQPSTRRVMVKLNDGFSGEGNAMLSLQELAHVKPKRSGGVSSKVRAQAVSEALGRLTFVSAKETWPRFLSELERIGGVVEAYVEGRRKKSPSVQLRIDPRGELEVMSSHDQQLAVDGQTYLGCIFPASEQYRLAIQRDALKVGAVLRERGVLGRVAVDFVTVETEPGRWKHYAIEINLRMTGTTHPFMLLKLATHGDYDAKSGLYLTASGEPRYYVSTDNLTSPSYRGLLPPDLLDIASKHKLHFEPGQGTGAIFHLLGALSQFGKVGMTCVGRTPSEAEACAERVRSVLDSETRG